ncbi:MAG: hypothetical protein JRI32_10585 [Deltaproteobacteria bacterium]|nr:hypothetical protein [Deltaproteobacteria bacterium]
MKVRIELTSDEVKQIVINHVLKEVPVHTAGKDVFAIENYGNWKIDIEDKEESDG